MLRTSTTETTQEERELCIKAYGMTPEGLQDWFDSLDIEPYVRKGLEFLESRGLIEDLKPWLESKDMVTIKTNAPSVPKYRGISLIERQKETVRKILETREVKTKESSS